QKLMTTIIKRGSSAFGLGWLAIDLFATLIIQQTNITVVDVVLKWIDSGSVFGHGIITGLLFGLCLVAIQPWLIKRRYGFVPRFFRTATMVGAVFSGLSLPLISMTFNWYQISLSLNGFMWFFWIPFFQAFTLIRISRYWWLLTWIGVGAGLLCAAMTIFHPNPLYGLVNGLALATPIQLIGSGTVILRLFSHRDKSHKEHPNLATFSSSLHPLVFISFWVIVYYCGFLASFAVFGYLREFDLDHRLVVGFTELNLLWVFALANGFMIGFISSTAQQWLFKQQSGRTIPHWILISTLSYMMMLLICWREFWTWWHVSEQNPLFYIVIWFTLPALWQTIPMWRTLRGGWIWLFSGIVGSLLAALISTNLDWDGNTVYPAVMFGGALHAVVTAITYLMLLAQDATTSTYVARTLRVKQVVKT
ncbi:MAG: hypothetical protein AAFV93_21365, partial [Chloroflexota bacterium]